MTKDRNNQNPKNMKTALNKKGELPTSENKIESKEEHVSSYSISSSEEEREATINKAIETAREIANKTVQTVEEITAKQLEEMHKYQDSALNVIIENMERHGIPSSSPVGTFIIDTFRNYCSFFANNIKYFINLSFEAHKQSINMFFTAYNDFVRKFIDYYEVSDEQWKSILSFFDEITSRWLSMHIQATKQFSEHIRNGLSLWSKMAEQYTSMANKQMEISREIQEKTFKIIEQWLNWWK